MTIPLLFSLLYHLPVVHNIDSSSFEEEKYVNGSNADFEAALQFLNRYQKKAVVVRHESNLAFWNYQNNLTDYNKKLKIEQDEKSARFLKEMWKEAMTFKWKDFKSINESTYRAFKHIAKLGNYVLPLEKYKELDQLRADMSKLYGKAKVCPYNNTKNLPCNWTLESEIKEIFQTSRNYDELLFYWDEWREATGKKLKEPFLDSVVLLNEASKLNGFSDIGAFRRDDFESDTFEEDIEDLWVTLKPFYEQLHAYVRKKLMKHYDGRINKNGPIPAHILGNMWAESWSNIYDLMIPYPNKTHRNLTGFMLEKKMTVLDMFKTAEEFFISLGLIPMPPEFWNNSIFEKPVNRDIECHPMSLNMHYKNDVRLRMCSKVNQEDLLTIHHEMGHVEYYLQYANQPYVFRNGANPGFHEAVGDALSLSVSTNKHMYKIGLLENDNEDEEIDINYLLEVAMEKISFLPFGYLIDAYRWKIYDGSINPEDLNFKWWEYRLKYQGICPPMKRTEADFDAGSKYHVAADRPYISYFVAFVIQFQFHKALCNASGYDGPLYKCDIYGNKEAGKLLSNMLSLGSSVHWGEAMRVITQDQTTKMDTGALLEYFSPLITWLQNENKDEYIGWNSEDPFSCPKVKQRWKSVLFSDK